MLRFHLSNKREQQQFEHDKGPLEIGRGPKRNDVARCVVQDLYVSKDHIRVEEREGNRVRIENLSQRNPVWFTDKTSLPPGFSQEFSLPIRLTVGETLVDIEAVYSHDSSSFRDPMLQTIASPRQFRASDSGRSLQKISTPDAETLIEWFETVIDVQRAAAGSPEFYDQTAQALIDLVGLDRGMVLLRRGDTWETVASAGREANNRDYSQTILQHVLADKKTYYQTGSAAAESMIGIQAVVASPIFDSRGENVVGVLYGSSSIKVGALHGLGIGRLQAYLVQLLASAVGAGLARVEQEAEATRQRVQFEQFFSPGLARELSRNPRLLEGQEREVTVMFADIRSFSQTAERLGPSDTCKLIADVMDRVTARIKEHQGVVVDYMGDGLLAMWNAPTDQPQHAALACRAALAILQDLPQLSKEWQPVLGSPLELGIGLNTGLALVGNTGSTYKFKYGPLGHTVNLASRVEGATKYLGIPVLITGSTRALLGNQFATRRLARVRLLGVRTPVDLYELHAPEASAEWLARRDAYERALEQYEKGEWVVALRSLHELVTGEQQDTATGQQRPDIPSLELASRLLDCLKNPPEIFDPVVEFKNK